MKREIKFRSWDYQKRKMFYDFDQDIKEVLLGNSIHLFVYETGLCFDTLMQYTGLKDKNGKEIYEGDVLKWYSGTMSTKGLPEDVRNQASQSLYDWQKTDRKKPYNYKANGWYEVFDKGVVVFYKGSFSLHNDPDTTNHEKNCKRNGVTYFGQIKSSTKYEIIGNIHENPELL